MSWKSIVITGLLCVVAVPALAVPSLIVAPRPYSAADGGIRWEVLVQQDANGALAVELPFTLGAHNGAAFAQFLTAGADQTNGPNAGTWYYNETAAGSSTLVWNTTENDPLNLNQNTGNNPFTGGITEGLQIDAAARRLFASLGSSVNLPDGWSAVTGKQVRTLHILTSDGILNWTDAVIAEDGLSTVNLTGSANSIIPGDMNGSGNRNPTTGAALDATTLADLGGWLQVVLNAPGNGRPQYAAANPGLNGIKRADMTGEGSATLADLGAFITAITTGAGGGSLSSGSVPEPTTAALVMLGVTLASALRVRRR